MEKEYEPLGWRKLDNCAFQMNTFDVVADAADLSTYRGIQTQIADRHKLSNFGEQKTVNGFRAWLRIIGEGPAKDIGGDLFGRGLVIRHPECQRINPVTMLLIDFLEARHRVFGSQRKLCRQACNLCLIQSPYHLRTPGKFQCSCRLKARKTFAVLSHCTYKAKCDLNTSSRPLLSINPMQGESCAPKLLTMLQLCMTSVTGP